MAARLPSGTVTFLFTDIEGSTRLLGALGEAYADVLADHRRPLREAFERHGGGEMGTEGDSFAVAFSRASDALAAAVDGQRALAETPVRVRMGIHTGEPRLTADGYVGMDVHRVARIAAAAHGGQILLSDQAARLVDDRDGRFAMLETIREYAHDRLVERGEADELARRHLRSLVRLAEEAERTLVFDFHGPSAEGVRAEHENVRVALASALESGEIELGMRLASALVFFWFHRDYLAEGERWLSALVDAEAAVSDRVRARALAAAATVVGVRGDGDRAIPLGEESVVLARRSGDPAALGRALLTRAHGLLAQGDAVALRETVEEALPPLRETRQDFGEHRAYQLLAMLAQQSGDFAEARALMNRSLSTWRERDAAYGVATTLHGLGDVELDAGRLADAHAAYAEGLRVAREQEAARVMCYCLGGLAAVAALEGDSARAATLWRSVRTLEQLGGFRLRDDRVQRYADLVGDLGSIGDSFPEESLLEDAAAYALGEAVPPGRA